MSSPGAEQNGGFCSQPVQPASQLHSGPSTTDKSPLSSPTSKKDTLPPIRCSPRFSRTPAKPCLGSRSRPGKDLVRFVAITIAACSVIVYLQAVVFRGRGLTLEDADVAPPLRQTTVKALEIVKEEGQRRSLAEAVAAASKHGGVVITSIVNTGYLDFTENWMKSIELLGYVNQVLLFAEDEEAYKNIDAQWPGHVVSLEHEKIPHANSSAHDFGSLGFYLMTERRPDYLRSILEFGVDVLYTDLDMVFLKDPFPSFSGDFDMWVQDDWGEFSDRADVIPMFWDERDTPNICSCLLYLRPTVGSLRVLKRWAYLMSKRSWEPNVQDQPYFNKALNTITDLRVGVLPQRHFPPGPFFFANDTWREAYASDVRIIHNNWVVGHDVKKQRFIERGVWYVKEDQRTQPSLVTGLREGASLEKRRKKRKKGPKVAGNEAKNARARGGGVDKRLADVVRKAQQHEARLSGASEARKGVVVEPKLAQVVQGDNLKSRHPSLRTQGVGTGKGVKGSGRVEKQEALGFEDGDGEEMTGSRAKKVRRSKRGFGQRGTGQSAGA